MSDFWVATNPPKEADIVAWCEGEVEKACRDLVKHISLQGWITDKHTDFTTYAYVGGDWEIDTDETGPTLCELLKDAAEDHVSYPYQPEKAGIYGAEAVKIEAALKNLEAVIAEVRSWIKEGPSPQQEESE